MKTPTCPHCSSCAHVVRHGFYKTKSGRRRRHRCTKCRKTFCSTVDAAYYRLQHRRSTFDEADTFLRTKAGENDEMRGILNSGHTRNAAYAIRCDGDTSEPRVFSSWSPVAIAMIGELPATLADRSIAVRMQRKAPGERVERPRTESFREEAGVLRQRAARWARDIAESLEGVEPDAPDALDDRARDNWEPLLAIAGVAGGWWPERARTVALGMSTGRDESEKTGGVALLHDLREVFRARSVDRIATQDILDALCNLDERPWPSYSRGAGGLNAKQLRGLLRPFGVRSRNLRLDGGRVAKGYFLDDLAGAFSRYLPRVAVTGRAQESLPLQALQALQREGSGTCDGSHALQGVPCSGSRTHASLQAGGM